MSFLELEFILVLGFGVGSMILSYSRELVNDPRGIQTGKLAGTRLGVYYSPNLEQVWNAMAWKEEPPNLVQSSSSTQNPRQVNMSSKIGVEIEVFRKVFQSFLEEKLIRKHVKYESQQLMQNFSFNAGSDVLKEPMVKWAERRSENFKDSRSIGTISGLNDTLLKGSWQLPQVDIVHQNTELGWLVLDSSSSYLSTLFSM